MFVAKQQFFSISYFKATLFVERVQRSQLGSLSPLNAPMKSNRWVSSTSYIPTWINETHSWTVSEVKKMGISLENANSILELFPISGKVDLTSSAKLALKLVPSASNNSEFIQLYDKQRGNIENCKDFRVQAFAKRLYNWCKFPQREPGVDALVEGILELCGFDDLPFYYLPKPKIQLRYNKLIITSIPDFAVYKTINSLSRISIAIENKVSTTSRGQLIGTALVCCLANDKVVKEYAESMPIINCRGTEISFERADFTSEFLKEIKLGRVPHNSYSKAIFFPGYPPGRRHNGCNLIEFDGRENAFVYLTILHKYLNPP